uniref:Putative tail protein n=1 Tax=viral metagenome TaxID=1070528 RepID=A0A6M3JCH7_9ZZZZ
MVVIQFEWPAGERQKIVETLEFQAEGLEDFSRGFNGGLSIWERFESRLRSRHAATFNAMTDPTSGTPWTPLTPAYAKRKPPGTRSKILYLTGELRRALTTPQGSGHITRRYPKALEWGVADLSSKPMVHQTTERVRKDGAPLKRRFLGLKLPDDFIDLRKIIQTELIARWTAKGGKVNG